MEVTTEEAQAVLLQGMEGAQYITIQRADGEPLSKGVPLLTLNGELISEGMVVDMINAEVGTDYAAATHYYAEDDLYQHELTEIDSKTDFGFPEQEDRRLAAALVAVQLQQQQKNQLHTQTQTEDVALSDVAQLQTLSTVNAYAIETVTEANATSVYPALQPFKRVTNNVKQEQQLINVKDEYDLDISAESSEDATQTSGPKKFLPHKKRIARKLKQETKKKRSAKKDNSKTNAVDVLKADTSGETQPTFKCEICGGRLSGQLKFFEHLKVHYEPVKQETRIAQAVNTNISFTGLDNTVMDEFSEPEDLMEGIRGVVERTGVNTDDDEADTPLTSVNNGPSLWTITDVIGNVNTKDLTKSPATNNQNSPKKEKTDIPETTKKKKTVRARRSNDELSCSQCDRTFHHKNSLVYHMRSHSGERPHQCEVCGKSFFAASALKVHKRLHSGDKPYKCEECGRHFRQWGDLKYHSTSIHSEQKQYQCEYCGKDFARKYSLIVHRRIHTGEKNYRCEYCNKTFRASSYLQNHRRIHTGEKPHPCTVCGKPFRVRSDMKRHMHTHSKTPHTRSSKSLPARVNPVKSLLEEEGEGEEEELTKERSQGKTIQDLVRELKLEVDATGVVEIVPPDDNPESILPHAGGQNLEFNVATQTDTNSDRDPLEAVVRTDNMQYFFM